MRGMGMRGEAAAAITNGIDPAAVLDISENMDEQGHLTWNASAGNWTILRIGYTTTGAQNGPAPDGGTGLECDKFDRKAIEFHFEYYFDELLEALKIGERADDIWAFQKESNNLTYDQREAIKRFSCFLHNDRKIVAQALSLLPKDEPCETCGGTVGIDTGGGIILPCHNPDCQPEQSEFTKRINNCFEKMNIDWDEAKAGVLGTWPSWLVEACERLEVAERKLIEGAEILIEDAKTIQQLTDEIKGLKEEQEQREDYIANLEEELLNLR